MPRKNSRAEDSGPRMNPIARLHINAIENLLRTRPSRSLIGYQTRQVGTIEKASVEVDDQIAVAST